mmetsp:Transcript_9887/g.27799  ORF Transcript_9887/g.27799 Transcript_9887/m.27799 type:complete len:375 (-) Transcript_9887:318-1442(-)
MACLLSCALILVNLFGISGLEVGRDVEGAQYMEECADAVIANKQELLFVPFKIAKTQGRDVGWMGHLPVLDAAKPEVSEGSLQTARELQGYNPMIFIASLKIKDTEQPAFPPPGYRYGASQGGEEILYYSGLTNPPADLTVWQWQQNRWSSLKAWLEYAIGRNPDKLVIIHSRGDVLYGGCSENIIKFKYEQIVGDGTQTIVAAAEVSPYPQDLGWWYSKSNFTETMRSQALSSLGVPSDWITKYAHCDNSTVNSMCGSPPKYQYASSGFLMGPALDLFTMLSGLESYEGPENRFINEYFLANPAKMTLDYSGSLSMTLHNLVKPDGSIPVEISGSGDSKKLVSKETNTTICFVHGNGNSFESVKVLAQELKDA